MRAIGTGIIEGRLAPAFKDDAEEAPPLLLQVARNGGLQRSLRRKFGAQLKSYSNGNTTENPSHMRMVSGIPTRRKSENL